MLCVFNWILFINIFEKFFTYIDSIFANGFLLLTNVCLRNGELKRMVKGVNSSLVYLIYCKNFDKCHNVPPPSTIKKIYALICFGGKTGFRE
jgi:hypothetical protein